MADLLSYGAYLRVPELLSLQSPVGPDVHDEMLFIVLQQAQELWFKQLLHDLGPVIDAIQEDRFARAVRGLDRINHIVRVLNAELGVMETLSPVEFGRFRHLLSPSSGFESAQFREIEYASGLRDASFQQLLDRVLDRSAIEQRWPVSLSDAFLAALSEVDRDPVRALVELYREPDTFPALHALSEALSEYEMGILEWRFLHARLVERVIGARSPGTGGSPGLSYLQRTLSYRFFPALAEARHYMAPLSDK